MKRISDTTILAFALIALVILAAIAVAVAPPPEAPTLSNRNDRRDGAMVLALWLERRGYNVREVLTYDQLDEVDVLFVLEPLWSQAAADNALALQRWVKAGHTLIAAGTPLALNPMIEPYDLTLAYLPFSSQPLSLAAPSLLTPPVDTFRADPAASIVTDRDGVVSHVFSGDDPVLVSLNEGQGRVWVSGALRPFTNEGLHDPNSAHLILNLLANVPRGSTIGFDESIHGFGAPVEQSLSGWLLGTAPGWGILLALIITMGFLALRGRRFGRAIPLPHDRLRRESVEYIIAMATLFRRSGQRQAILAHYNEQVRRRVAERYPIDPRLDTTDFANALAYYEPALDATSLRQMMERLSQQQISEHDLVKTVFEVHHFLRSMN
ncbi:MAG: DUF4350 domain-containing protein [Anaerolineae bacterium]|nr:DUF4350 domain-containing protein [Anaerolineae bacterium]